MTGRLLGLTGKAGAGKDYVFGRLRELIPGTVRIGFADSIKQDIEKTLGSDAPNLHHKPYRPEVRSLLQWWGTELRRAVDPEYWITVALPRLEDALKAAPLVVITDVRYRNEAETIRALQGMVVEVYADELVRQHRLGGVLPPNHASEELGFPVDCRILNSGTLVASPDVTEFIGLDPFCFHCRSLVRHPFRA